MSDQERMASVPPTPMHQSEDVEHEAELQDEVQKKVPGPGMAEESERAEVEQSEKKKEEENHAAGEGHEAATGLRPRGNNRRVTTVVVNTGDAQDVEIDTMPGEVAKEIEKLKVLPAEELKAEERRLLRKVRVTSLPIVHV